MTARVRIQYRRFVIMPDKRTQLQRRQRNLHKKQQLKKENQAQVIDMIIENDSEQNKD